MEDTIPQGDVREPRPGIADVDASQTRLATARQSSALSASPASSGGIYMNENQAGVMARLMQREFDNTHAEMAAMSSELRAVKTASGTCAATFVTCN